MEGAGSKECGHSCPQRVLPLTTLGWGCFGRGCGGQECPLALARTNPIDSSNIPYWFVEDLSGTNPINLEIVMRIRTTEPKARYNGSRWCREFRRANHRIGICILREVLKGRYMGADDDGDLCRPCRDLPGNGKRFRWFTRFRLVSHTGYRCNKPPAL